MAFPYKTVLVIGATSGIGQALAERMIQNGIFVIVVGRRKERLDEFVVKHGSDKAAASQFDITNLEGTKAWATEVTTKYPSIDAVVLNSGIQRVHNFTRPAEINLGEIQSEITTNYTAYLFLITAFLPHLQARAPQPAAMVMVSSGLAVIPIPRNPNYCGIKAGIHSLCWTLRAQLAHDEGSKHIRVIEIIPPAVQTELHTQQEELVKAGISKFGMPLEDFTNDAWECLLSGEDELPVGPIKERIVVEQGRREMFAGMVQMFVQQGGVFPKPA